MTGRQGMVARVDGWPALSDGSLVVLQDDAGLLTGLVGSATPEPSWRCRLLGAPLVVDGQRRRLLYVPERCLTAVGEMNDDQVQELARQQAEAEADALVAELGRALAGPVYVSEAQLARAGEQALIEHCLEKVAAATALREAGFRPVNPGGELLRRDIGQGQARLRLEAAPTPFGTWQLTTVGVAPGEIHCDEALLPGEAPRGQVLAEVLRLWRSAYPQGPVPAKLEPGEVFVRHHQTLRAAARAPSIEADPQVFRAILRWLRERFGYRAEELSAALSHADGLLRIEVAGVAFGCPARGLWPEGCAVGLADLLSLLGGGTLLRRRLTLTLTPTALAVNDSEIRRH